MNNAFLLSIAPSLDMTPFMDAAQLNAAVGNNVGNLAFVHAINMQLGGGLPRLRRLERVETINAMPGTAVLPCANHLGAHINLAGEAAHFSGIRKPMVAIGLGAQGSSKMAELPVLPEGSERWLRGLADRAPGSAPNISVRGEYTMRVLEKYGVADRAVVLGCPTLFLNPNPDLGQRIAKALERPIKRVAVAAGHYRWRHLYKLEASLAKLVEETGGAYILQSPLEMLKVYRGEVQGMDPATLDEMRDSILPGRSTEQMVEWYRRYSIAFFNIPEWMNYLRTFDFVVGPRIHGVMLALQAGVPGLCIAHDSRTVELCQTMKVPYVGVSDVVDGIDFEDLKRLVNFDATAFDKRRSTLAAAYGEFIKDNGLRVGSDIDRIRGSA